MKFKPNLSLTEQVSVFIPQLNENQRESIQKKSERSGYPTSILEQVYKRGILAWTAASNQTPEQYAFNRINSFIAGGAAADLDEDLKQACWKGYEAVGMKMKNGKKVPNCVPTKEEYEVDASRRSGAIKRAVYESQCDCEYCQEEETLNERGADSEGYYRSTESGAGLTAKGAKHFGIQTAVTEKKPTGKRAARRRSFCARMGGMKGPMKDEKGRPTRKAASLKRWRC